MVRTRARRRRRAVAAVLALAIGGIGVAAPVGAAAEDDCAAPDRLLAVDADTGHLNEVTGCSYPGTLTVGAEVDAGDWRGRQIIAARAGEVTVVYSRAPYGPVEARRQDAPGAALGTPVPVGTSTDWTSINDLIVAGPGYLAGATRTGLRLFRHVGWDTGGSTLVDGPTLGLTVPGNLSAFTAGSPVRGVYAGAEWLVWPQGVSTWGGHNGQLPASNTVPVGGLRYGTANGTIVQLTHPPEPGYGSCPVNSNPWQVSAELPGSWALVVAPVAGLQSDDWPLPQAPNPGRCAPGGSPYEWQF